MVDAICINQTNLSERASQVEMMADIYKKAVTTVSWLGEGDADSDEAVELVREPGNWMGEHRQEFDDRLEEKDDTETPVTVIESLGFSLKDRNWEAVWRLFERPYWSRVWIIQELAARGDFLMGANGVFYCGSKSFWRFQFDGFCAVILFIIQAGPSASLQHGQVGNHMAEDAAVFQMHEPMASLQKRMHPPGLRMAQTPTACRSTKYNEHRHIDWLLRLTRRFQATDSRDKLYALKGLVTDGELVTPDYSKSFEEVVREFALNHIQGHSSLNIILGDRVREQVLTPSWVPDSLAEDRRTALSLVPSTQMCYRAAGDRESLVTYNNSSHSLSCRGLVVGTVNKVIGPLVVAEGSDALDALGNHVALGQNKVFYALRQLYRALGDERSREILWRTLCVDTNTSDTVLGTDEMTPALADYGT